MLKFAHSNVDREVCDDGQFSAVLGSFTRNEARHAAPLGILTARRLISVLHIPQLTVHTACL